MEFRPDLDEVKRHYDAAYREVESARDAVEQHSASLVREEVPESLTAWAKYLTPESIYVMLRAMGEVFLRESDVTLAHLKEHGPRVAAGFNALVRLGAQGNISEEQFQSMLELREVIPPPVERVPTIRSIADLSAMVRHIPNYKQCKYSNWWYGDVDTLISAIWCIGGLVSEPLGDELTASQKQFVDRLGALQHGDTKNANDVVVATRALAYADFARTYTAS